TRWGYTGWPLAPAAGGGGGYDTTLSPSPKIVGAANDINRYSDVTSTQVAPAYSWGMFGPAGASDPRLSPWARQAYFGQAPPASLARPADAAPIGLAGTGGVGNAAGGGTGLQLPGKVLAGPNGQAIGQLTLQLDLNQLRAFILQTVQDGLH